MHEIISLAIGSGVNSKAVWNIYNLLINKFGNEFNVMLFISKEEIFNLLKNEFLTDLIILNREGKIQVKPGYDGVYGKALIGGKEVNVDEEESNSSKKNLDEDNKTIAERRFRHNINENSKEFNEAIRKSGEVQKKLF